MHPGTVKPPQALGAVVDGVVVPENADPVPQAVAPVAHQVPPEQGEQELSTQSQVRAHCPGQLRQGLDHTFEGGGDSPDCTQADQSQVGGRAGEGAADQGGEQPVGGVYGPGGFQCAVPPLPGSGTLAPVKQPPEEGQPTVDHQQGQAYRSDKRRYVNPPNLAESHLGRD